MASLTASLLSEITGTDSHIAPSTTSESSSTMAQATTQQTSRPEFVFLVLSPVLSTTYPASSSPVASPITSPTVAGAEAPAPEAEPVKKERRSSSVSSDGPFKRKVLKLGPIHGGQSSGSDFVELDEE